MPLHARRTVKTTTKTHETNTTYTQHPFTFNIDEGWQAMWRAVRYTEVSHSHTWEKWQSNGWRQWRLKAMQQP